MLFWSYLPAFSGYFFLTNHVKPSENDLWKHNSVEFDNISLYTVYEPDTDVDLPGRPLMCLVRISCRSFSWHSGRIGLDTGPILLRGYFLLFAAHHEWIFFKSEFVFICVLWFFMLSMNSYVSESDASLNLLLFRFSIALSSSKSRFDSASSVFFFGGHF